MDQQPERDIRWLFEAEPEPAPEGWTTLSNIVRPLGLQMPLAVRPCPFERFLADVPADADMWGLTCAALWAVIELCPTRAVLTKKFKARRLSGLLTPPPPGRRHESANKYVSLVIGDVGTGTSTKGVARRFEKLSGRPVLLRQDEVIAALVAFGLADADMAGVEIVPATIPSPKNTSPVAKGVGRPRKRDRAAMAMQELYPAGSPRPPLKIMLRAVSEHLGESISPDTILRAEGRR